MRGRIEVITGGMYAGKSEELVRRLRRAWFARKKIIAFKHFSDKRYHETHIGCHTGETFEAHPVSTIEAIASQAVGYDVVGIDEVQFFDESIVGLCEHLANSGVRVIVAGLDQDSLARAFGPIPPLMAIAEDVTKLHAVCVVCGEEASRSFHKGLKEHQVEVGAKQYEARCRKHWLSAEPLPAPTE